jgi:acyl-CoA reductase-like NAD-dependent aldehyde dehydrogenase
LTLHLPILRAGEPYESLKKNVVRDIRSGEPLAEVSMANRGLIALDLAVAAKYKRQLAEFDTAALVAICHRAAVLFMEAELPLGDSTQTAEDYVSQTSASTGLPHALCRANMHKIATVLGSVEKVLDGLTRGLDLAVLDDGALHPWQDRNLSYLCQTNALGCVLPSNSPGVHSLWLPSIPLKVPVVLKPGAEEPWTPFRVAQALVAAGCPPQAFGFYPTDHSGAAEILLQCGRSLLFGGGATVDPWRTEPGVQIHGPGRSKILLGSDAAPEWSAYLELIEHSVADNGGRSCINASGVWTPSHGRELAEELAQRLARIEARALDDDGAQIAAFSNPEVAGRIDQMIDAQLKGPGAEDLTATYRDGGRLVQTDGCTFLLPTVVWCEDSSHPLADTEFLFPFVSVVEAPQAELPEAIGPSLVVTALTNRRDFVVELLNAPNVERLNIGPIPTNRIEWDQPHEGNLFELLYQQRALQVRSSGPLQDALV